MKARHKFMQGEKKPLSLDEKISLKGILKKRCSLLRMNTINTRKQFIFYWGLCVGRPIDQWVKA